MFGGYSNEAGGGRKAEPRVMHVSVDRVGAVRARPLRFLVSMHEEGTALTWRHTVEVPADVERQLVARTAKLHLWSLNMGLTVDSARQEGIALGNDLGRAFLGGGALDVLTSSRPTAILLSVDETMLNLPWEAMRCGDLGIDPGVPFGRIISSAVRPRARRDPVAENPTLRVLVVANPTDNLPASESVVAELTALRGSHDAATVEVDVLATADATRAGFADAVKGQDYDIVHFAGHGLFKNSRPHESFLQLADGNFEAADIATLSWSAPPYIVYNSACESARATARQGLVSRAGNANGLVGAFLAAGSEAYIGHFWPVQDESAAQFTRTFYTSLFVEKNVGTAVTAARRRADEDFVDRSDLTGAGTIFFGDAGTAERKDLATAS